VIERDIRPYEATTKRYTCDLWRSKIFSWHFLSP